MMETVRNVMTRLARNKIAYNLPVDRQVDLFFTTIFSCDVAIAKGDRMLLGIQDYDFCPNPFKFFPKFARNFPKLYPVYPNLPKCYPNLSKLS